MDSKSTGGIIQILISERDKVYIIWISKISLSKHPIPTHKNENKMNKQKTVMYNNVFFLQTMTIINASSLNRNKEFISVKFN